MKRRPKTNLKPPRPTVIEGKEEDDARHVKRR